MVQKTLRIYVTITEYRRVTDGQTDIFQRHSPRYAYASRGKQIANQKLFKVIQAY